MNNSCVKIKRISWPLCSSQWRDCFKSVALGTRFEPEGCPAVLWTPIFGRNTRKIHLISSHVKGKHAFWTAVFNVWLKAVWAPQHGHPNRGRPRTTYIDTMRADSGLDNTKETRDAMLHQVVRNDFVRMAQDDFRPEKAHKHISTFQS